MNLCKNCGGPLRQRRGGVGRKREFCTNRCRWTWHNQQRPRPEARFFELSLEMERHSRGQHFGYAMLTFPSAKFHEWCDLGKQLEKMAE